jgi:hypothetical protein
LGFTFSTALADEIAIKAGAIVDPVSATIAQNQTILVEDGKIKAIGNNLTLPAGATIIDSGDTWIMTLQRRPGYRAIPDATLNRHGVRIGTAEVYRALVEVT